MDSMLHQSSNQNFFKVMMGDFRKKLRLPKALNLSSKVNVPTVFTLVSPTGGRSWMVAVKRVGDNFFLSNGWKAFAEDYDLEMGEFVLFRDEGRNVFNVKVFGKNACEKEVRITNRKEVPLTNRNTEEVANHVTFKYPFFTATVPKNDLNWYSTLIIPNSFAKKNLKDNHLGVTRAVTLRVKTGGTWNLRYSVGVHSRLVGGWKDFVEGNNLKGGDFLVFELVDKNHIQMNVSIIRS
ncbi:B3 domain-containing protein rem14 [Thalictrum thalictroides]|uniref:B3 domain-containing protein rem14 n=1 Tax=Thalictrum thalictroides TaxID=46969 RepID=A0A7J6WCN8_THATH|nr:B3 domain-containing protein rem14 [Thalictrum thalictroides]